ncbi:porin [Caballeronia turbans]|uniref:porin n=1 Tax=unclassified Caballeronia TaxID=2646786 RepID=UPI00074B3FE6|nr:MULTISPECIES: porin [unclassified Caballeronia]SAL37245.1 porin [Caballeronia turbans]
MLRRRKIKRPIIAAIATLTCGAASAQSSVTLYGIIDAGVTYTNRVDTPTQKGAVVQFTSGSSQGSRWGLRGSEDLGGGLKAIFALENGFDVGTGALGQGGLEFGRQAFVGLSSNWGTLTLGRQYDFIGDIFPAFAVGSNTPAGLLAWSLPAYAAGGYSLDNRVWGDQVNNAVKYQSPSIAGFTLGGMYGFGNVAGSMGTNSSSNFVVSYDNGPLSAALAYMSRHNATPSANSREFAGGAAYMIGKARLFGMVSDVQLSSGTKPRATTYEAGLAYQVIPTLSLAGGAQYQHRNNGVGSANQLTLSGDYFLSKRTDVYFVAALAHDHGFSAQAQAALGDASGTDVQTAVRIGIRHKF